MGRSRKGSNYEIDDPVELAFDVFGHLYVVDEKRVFVFGRDRQFMLRFPSSDDTPGAPRKIVAFALDRFGSFFIADDDDKQIVQYQ